MRKIFLDTCGILALLNNRDFLHPNAVLVNSILLLENVSFYTTDYILVEVGNALAKNKSLAIKALDYLQNSPDVQLIKITEEELDQSLQIYKQYTDKEWGLTDISSFIVMNRLNISEAFTNDDHFKQYGFKNLLE